MRPTGAKITVNSCVEGFSNRLWVALWPREAPGAPFDTNKPPRSRLPQPKKRPSAYWPLVDVHLVKYQRHPGMLSRTRGTVVEHNSQELLMFHNQFRAQSCPILSEPEQQICSCSSSQDASQTALLALARCTLSRCTDIGLYLPLHRLWVLADWYLTSLISPIPHATKCLPA